MQVKSKNPKMTLATEENQKLKKELTQATIEYSANATALDFYTKNNEHFKDCLNRLRGQTDSDKVNQEYYKMMSEDFSRKEDKYISNVILSLDKIQSIKQEMGKPFGYIIYVRDFSKDDNAMKNYMAYANTFEQIDHELQAAHVFDNNANYAIYDIEGRKCLSNFGFEISPEKIQADYKTLNHPNDLTKSGLPAWSPKPPKRNSAKQKAAGKEERSR